MRYLTNYIVSIALLAAAFHVGADQEPSSKDMVEKELQELVIGQLNRYFDDKDLSLSFRRLDNESSSLKDGYAVDYNWKRTLSKEYGTNYKDLLDKKTTNLNYGARKLDLFAEGSYARDDVVNKESLSRIGLSAGIVRGITTSLDMSQFQKEMTQCLTEAIADDKSESESAAATKKCTDLYSGPIPGSYVYDVGLHYQVEGDQDFTQKQNAYGAHFGLAATLPDKKNVKMLNIPDWFFMLTRWAFNDEHPFEANGYYPDLPTLTVNYEQVDPTDNDPRKALADGDKTFERFVFVSAFKTRVAKYEEESIFFEWVYHRYLEDGAPNAVKAAGLDDFEFNRFSLFMPTSLFGVDNVDGNHQVFVRYAKGDLPFDITSDGVVSIGWETDLKTLWSALK